MSADHQQGQAPNKPSMDELQAKIRYLEGERDAKNTIKVSKQGAVQVNGIRGFGVTYYLDEWDEIFAMEDRVRTFILENRDRLYTKAEAKERRADAIGDNE